MVSQPFWHQDICRSPIHVVKDKTCFDLTRPSPRIIWHCPTLLNFPMEGAKNQILMLWFDTEGVSQLNCIGIHNLVGHLLLSWLMMSHSICKKLRSLVFWRPGLAWKLVAWACLVLACTFSGPGQGDWASARPWLSPVLFFKCYGVM